MNKERFLASGLIEQYVLGLTTPDETQEVERYAKAYPEVQAELDALRGAIEQYAAQYAVPPSKELKEKILSEIEAEEQMEKRIRTDQTSRMRKGISHGWLFAAAALALIAIGAAFWSWWRYQDLSEDYDYLATQYATIVKQCDELQKQEQINRQVVALVNNDATRVVHLTGTDINPEAHVVVYWNEATQSAMLHMVEMPEPPPGKQYQIWADVEGVMINAGLLEEAGERNLQPINVIAEAESLNITIEPKGGSEHPTVERLIANGKI